MTCQAVWLPSGLYSERGGALIYVYSSTDDMLLQLPLFVDV